MKALEEVLSHISTLEDSEVLEGVMAQAWSLESESPASEPPFAMYKTTDLVN